MTQIPNTLTPDEERSLAQEIVNKTNPTRPEGLKQPTYSTRTVWFGALSKTLYAFIGSYMLSVFGSLAMRWFIGESSSLVAFTNSLLHLTTMLAFPALILALLFRRLILACGLMIIAGVWVVWFGGHLLPKNIAPPPDDAPRLSVMTFNLLVSNNDYDALVETIQTADPDILLLQELSDPAAQALSTRLDYPYVALDAGGVRGIGAMSRYPIAEAQTLDRVFKHQRLEIDFDGLPLVVYNVHPPTPFGRGGFQERDTVIDYLLGLASADADETDVIFAGDFNLTELGERYPMIRERFDDAFLTAGQGMGWTYALRGEYLLARIDYIFYAGALRPLSADVLDRSGSDHAPILAEFVFGEP